jgi:integrase
VSVKRPRESWECFLWTHAILEGGAPAESARLAAAAGGVPAHLYPLIATFLLTGGRRAEVLGLEVADVSFDHKAVRVPQEREPAPAQDPDLTADGPALAPARGDPPAIRVQPGPAPDAAPLSAVRQSGEVMLTDFRKVLNRVTVPAGWESGAITSKMFRHTHCSARLATLDRGAPVSPDTVSREMGHSSRDLVEQVYGHLGRNPRHRAEAAEYRVEQHAGVLGDRLAALYRHFEGSSDTTADTEPQRRPERSGVTGYIGIACPRSSDG